VTGSSTTVAAGSLRFASAPALLPAYLRILLSRKPRLAVGGIPRIEASLSDFRIDAAHLARYREICGEHGSHDSPIAYAHTLATPLHLAMLASSAFPLNLLGVVHVRNRIVQKRPLRADDTGEIHVYIEPDRMTSRGQELKLQTDVRVGGEAIWSETSTLLSRSSEQRPVRAAGPSTSDFDMPPREHARTDSFAVPVATGRRYARVSGDFNPIHMADFLARMFGFKRAIAHGMWSLARCAAAIGPAAFAKPCALDTAFKLPISFPANVILESWSVNGSYGLVLRDARGARAHLLGKIAPL
jgi:acyl dehydratase